MNYTCFTFGNQYTKHVCFQMKDHLDTVSFRKAVDAIPLMGMTTRIDRAMRLAQKELFATKNGAREGVTKMLILLTDGSQTPGTAH